MLGGAQKHSGSFGEEKTGSVLKGQRREITSLICNNSVTTQNVAFFRIEF